MRINSNVNDYQPIDVNELAFELEQKHPETSNVFSIVLDGQLFLYKPLCRKAYKQVSLLEISALEKEDLVCQDCVLWPENFDFDECDAGVPSKLAEAILKNSYVDSIEIRQNIINMYRQEMFDIDNQVTCMIHEAFPEYRIEEIETWDMQKTAEYCSKAEWILANLRGANYSRDPFTGRSLEELEADRALAEQELAKQQEQQKQNIETEEITNEIKQDIAPKNETVAERQQRLQLNAKQKLTYDQLVELKNKYPELDWNSLVQDMDDGLNDIHGGVDTTAPALRPGWR